MIRLEIRFYIILRFIKCYITSRNGPPAPQHATGVEDGVLLHLHETVRLGSENVRWHLEEWHAWNSVNEMKINNGNTFQNAPVCAAKPWERRRSEREREGVRGPESYCGNSRPEGKTDQTAECIKRRCGKGNYRLRPGPESKYIMF